MINRKLYKQIKKMDRQEMEQYIESVYSKGFNDGVESGDNADFRINLSQVLLKTKGIGDKLFQRIMENAKEFTE